MTRTTTGSALVTALEDVWEEIRSRHPELPEVVIITGSGQQGLGLKWGHFWDKAWMNGRFIASTDGTIERDRKPEMFVSGERLGVGAAETLQTMLHEAAHALAAIREVKDTSRQNRYHNRKFLEIAREVGLDYLQDAPHGTIGFSEVVITEATREEYGEIISELQRKINLTMELPGWASLLGLTGGSGTGTGGDGVKGRRAPKTTRGGLQKAVCECGRIIRVARATFEAAEIECKSCYTAFALEGAE